MSDAFWNSQPEVLRHWAEDNVDDALEHDAEDIFQRFECNGITKEQADNFFCLIHEPSFNLVPAEARFERLINEMPDDKLADLIRGYVAESNHQSWEGYTKRDMIAFRELFRDIERMAKAKS